MVAAVGMLLMLGGLVLLVFNLRGAWRAGAAICFVLGIVFCQGAFFADIWDRSPIGRLGRTAQGPLWLRIAAVILWLVVLPVAAFVAFTYLHPR
jgi:hypothetical protein